MCSFSFRLRFFESLVPDPAVPGGASAIVASSFSLWSACAFSFLSALDAWFDAYGKVGFGSVDAVAEGIEGSIRLVVTCDVSRRAWQVV
jgi:hypothetical protein